MVLMILVSSRGYSEERLDIERTDVPTGELIKNS